MMIKNLHTTHLKGVWQIVCNDNPSLSMKKELVIDIERLPTRTARELEKYVKGKISNAQKTSKKKQKKNQLGFIGEEERPSPSGFIPDSAPINNTNTPNVGGHNMPAMNPGNKMGMGTNPDMHQNIQTSGYDNTNNYQPAPANTGMGVGG